MVIVYRDSFALAGVLAPRPRGENLLTYLLGTDFNSRATSSRAACGDFAGTVPTVLPKIKPPNVPVCGGNASGRSKKTLERQRGAHRG
jgi:hypothetical protein